MSKRSAAPQLAVLPTCQCCTSTLSASPLIWKPAPQTTSNINAASPSTFGTLGSNARTGSGCCHTLSSAIVHSCCCLYHPFIVRFRRSPPCRLSAVVRSTFTAVQHLPSLSPCYHGSPSSSPAPSMWCNRTLLRLFAESTLSFVKFWDLYLLDRPPSILPFCPTVVVSVATGSCQAVPEDFPQPTLTVSRARSCLLWLFYVDLSLEYNSIEFHW
jgi:hypothetical protein